ncbi:hypothetical protein MNB_SV-14-1280 [hydrothermal vent metagenome]|uniref:Uncharacterized protein n=1 Tax=hydrothermal vent metagenome TaxID=652676 RepID=A0A1W1CI32_9ZZZZ
MKNETKRLFFHSYTIGDFSPIVFLFFFILKIPKKYFLLFL